MDVNLVFLQLLASVKEMLEEWSTGSMEQIFESFSH